MTNIIVQIHVYAATNHYERAVVSMRSSYMQRNLMGHHCPHISFRNKILAGSTQLNKSLKRVFDLVMRNRTSKSLFRTRSSTAFIAPAALRPCRFATPSQARCWLRSTSANGWTPRSDAIFVSPLARKRTSGKQSRLAATGDYAPSLRSPWRAAKVFVCTMQLLHCHRRKE